MEDFKTISLEILKQEEEEQGKKYEKKKSIENFEELFVEQQRKMLTSHKNEDSGVFS